MPRADHRHPDVPSRDPLAPARLAGNVQVAADALRLDRLRASAAGADPDLLAVRVVTRDADDVAAVRERGRDAPQPEVARELPVVAVLLVRVERKMVRGKRETTSISSCADL